MVGRCEDIFCFGPDGTKYNSKHTGFRVCHGDYTATIWECGVYYVWHIHDGHEVVHMCNEAFLTFDDCLFDAAHEVEMLSTGAQA